MQLQTLTAPVSAGLRITLNRTRLRRREKVFAIGFNKSGTSSLHALFKSLGLSSYHGVEWRTCQDDDLLQSYDCFSDDIPADLPKLDRMFPGAKFILQVRELDSWVYSRLAHIDRRRSKSSAYRTAPEWDTTEESIQIWIARRNQHHVDTIAYFRQRPSDLLVVNYIRDERAGSRICDFLGYPGMSSRPIKNRNPSATVPEKYREMLYRCSEKLGIPAAELRNDILCPSLLDEEARGQYPADTAEL